MMHSIICWKKGTEKEGGYEYFALVVVWRIFEWHPRQQDEADEEQKMARLKEFVLNKERASHDFEFVSLKIRSSSIDYIHIDCSYDCMFFSGCS